MALTLGLLARLSACLVAFFSCVVFLLCAMSASVLKNVKLFSPSLLQNTEKSNTILTTTVVVLFIKESKSNTVNVAQARNVCARCCCCFFSRFIHSLLTTCLVALRAVVMSFGSFVLFLVRFASHFILHFICDFILIHLFRHCKFFSSVRLPPPFDYTATQFCEMDLLFVQLLFANKTNANRICCWVSAFSAAANESNFLSLICKNIYFTNEHRLFPIHYVCCYAVCCLTSLNSFSFWPVAIYLSVSLICWVKTRSPFDSFDEHENERRKKTRSLEYLLMEKNEKY